MPHSDSEVWQFSCGRAITSQKTGCPTGLANGFVVPTIDGKGAENRGRN